MKKMTWEEMTKAFWEAEREGRHLDGIVVMTEDSWPDLYPLESRAYHVSSDNKAFQPGMGGYSIYGSALDGSDPLVRLDLYLAAEHGGSKGWKVEYCYIGSIDELYTVDGLNWREDKK